MVEAGSADIGAEGVIGGPGVGCDWLHINNSPFFIGIFTRYDFENINGRTGIDSLLIDRNWTLGGRAGFDVTSKTTIYGVAGYSWSHMTGGVLGATSMEAPMVGAGIEHQLNPNWGLKLEYDFTPYGHEALGPFVKTDGPDVHVVRVGLTFSFASRNEEPVFEDTSHQRPPLK